MTYPYDMNMPNRQAQAWQPQMNQQNYPMGQPFPQPVPNYAQQYYNMQQPAMQTQPVPNQSPQTLTGRTVNALDEIKLEEVPMNGNPSIFPLSDNSCIYTKVWGTDGTIITKKYIPVENDIPKESVNASGDSVLNTIMERLDKIEKMLAEKPRYSGNQRKEVKVNG